MLIVMLIYAHVGPVFTVGRLCLCRWWKPDYIEHVTEVHSGDYVATKSWAPLKKTKEKKTQCFQYIVDSDICFPISHQFSETVPILVCSSLLMLKCPQYAKRQQDYFFNIRTVTFDHNGTFVDMNRSMCNFNSFSFFLQYSCSTGFARD